MVVVLIVRRKMNRKQFIKSHGGTCDNWTWSWSFVNHEKRFVIFGAWDRFSDGKKEMILTQDWQINRGGRKSPGYSQSREHIRLVEEDAYELYTFPMTYSGELEGDDGTGPGKIGGFIPELHRKSLTKVVRSWYAGEEGVLSTLPEEVPTGGNFSEGAKSSITINAYERSAKARGACIAHHGVSCAVCSFDFEKAFGDLGAGFIHVHHIVPLSSIRDNYEVDPVTDLVPVCPNCHAMIHRVEPPLKIEQLTEHLTKIKNGKKSAQSTPNDPTVI